MLIVVQNEQIASTNSKNLTDTKSLANCTCTWSQVDGRCQSELVCFYINKLNIKHHPDILVRMPVCKHTACRHICLHVYKPKITPLLALVVIHVVHYMHIYMLAPQCAIMCYPCHKHATAARPQTSTQLHEHMPTYIRTYLHTYNHAGAEMHRYRIIKTQRHTHFLQQANCDSH